MADYLTLAAARIARELPGSIEVVSFHRWARRGFVALDRALEAPATGHLQLFSDAA